MPLVDHVRRQRRRYSLSASLLVPPGVAAGFVPVRTTFSHVGAALVLVAVVEAMAVVGRRPGGVLASVSAAVSFDYFLTTPYERFTISQRTDLETTVALFVVGLIVTELAARSRSHQRSATEEGAYVSLLARTAAMSSGSRSRVELIDAVVSGLTQILSLRDCRFEPDLSGPPFAQIVADGSVVHVGMRWPAEELGIPGPAAEIPCVWRGTTRGRFILTPTPGLAVTREQRVVAVALVNVAAPSLDPARAPDVAHGPGRGR